jgi:uncharacterized PurR-regulated membrane protein YhhQ (DUF165 family)
VSGFEAGVRADSRIGAAGFSQGTANARGAGALIGRAHLATPIRRANGVRRFSGALLAPLQLVLPVALLLTISVAALLYGGTRAPWPGVAPWLTLGELLVPLTFLAIHITNRRYGAAYALAQVLGAWAFGLTVLWAMRADLSGLVNWPVPDAREMLAFGAALLLAQIAAVAVFDRTRGPKWWHAPFYASLLGGTILCCGGFPAAFGGTAVDWVSPMFAYLMVMTAASFVLLAPYWAIRGVVPPMPGFGGY